MLRKPPVCIVAAWLLLLTLPSAVAGQTSGSVSQTGWHTIDEPRLEGPKGWWFREHRGNGRTYWSKGHRDDYFWTTAIGNSATHASRAVWEMGNRVGRQVLEVYVPGNHTVATMTYKIGIGDTSYSKRIVQGAHTGWTRLGEFDVYGRQVTITLDDSESEQDFGDYPPLARDRWPNGYPPASWLASFFGVDAMRIRCIDDCSSGSPPPTSAECVASAKFIEDVRTPSVGASRLLDLYCEAVRVQCPGTIRWNDVAAVALKESTHGQLAYRIADVLPESAVDREFDVRKKFDNGLIVSRPPNTRLGDYAGKYLGIPRTANPNGARYDLGPMQFAPATWEEVWRSQAKPIDGIENGHGTNGAFPDPHNFRSAVHATAAHLCHLHELASRPNSKHNPTGIDATSCAFAMYNAGSNRRLSEFDASVRDRLINCDDFLGNNRFWPSVKRYVNGGVAIGGYVPGAIEISQDYRLFAF